MRALTQGPRESRPTQRSIASAQLFIDLASSIGILQDESTTMTIDKPPFLYLIQGSKTADAGIVIV